MVFLHLNLEAPQGSEEAHISDLLTKQNIARLEADLKNDPHAKEKKDLHDAGAEAVAEKTAGKIEDFAKELGVGKKVDKKGENEQHEQNKAKTEINPYEKIPTPPENAPSGKQIMEKIKQLPPEQRQNYLAEQFKNGNITMKFYPITEELKDAKGKHILGEDGKPIVATRYVSGPIAFGTKDPVYYPVSGVTASVGATRVGCVLPTAKTVLDMEAKGKLIPYISYEQVADESGVPKKDETRYEYNYRNGKLVKSPKGSLMRDAKMYEAHHRLTQKEMEKRGLKAGDNFYGASKTIIASPVIENRDEEAIFGGRFASNGKIVQPAPVKQGPHEGPYDDYTNMPQYFVCEKMEIIMNGKKHIVSTRDILECGKEKQMPDGTKKIQTVLGRQDLHKFLSDVGPMSVNNMYKNTKGIDNPPVIVDIPMVEVGKMDSNTPSLEKPTDEKQAKPSIESPPPSASSTPSFSPPAAVPKSQESEATMVPRSSADSTISTPSPTSRVNSNPDYGNAPISSPHRSMPVTEEGERKIENPSIPQRAGTVLGDSYMAGALQFINKGPHFKNYSFQANFDPQSPDSMIGKHLPWMKDKLKQIIPDLKQTSEKPVLALLGGINDIMVDLTSEEDVDREYQKIATNFEAIFTMAHQNEVLVVAATIPPMGRFIRHRFQDSKAQELHFKLWEKVNAYLVNHEKKPNGPDKVVRLDLQLADPEDKASISGEYANKSDPLHTNTEGKRFMAAHIQQAMVELEREDDAGGK